MSCHVDEIIRLTGSEARLAECLSEGQGSPHTVHSAALQLVADERSQPKLTPEPTFLLGKQVNKVTVLHICQHVSAHGK